MNSTQTAPVKIDPYWVHTSISFGTLDNDIIVDNIRKFAEAYQRDYLIALCDEYDAEYCRKGKRHIFCNPIWSYMNGIAPEGCYFGSLMNDGSHFGFWTLGSGW